MNGKDVLTMELALKYGFVDLSGKLPDGQFSSAEFAAQIREQISQTPTQYNLEAEIPDATTNTSEIKGFFPGYPQNAPRFQHRFLKELSGLQKKKGKKKV